MIDHEQTKHHLTPMGERLLDEYMGRTTLAEEALERIHRLLKGDASHVSKTALRNALRGDYA